MSDNSIGDSESARGELHALEEDREAQEKAKKEKEMTQEEAKDLSRVALEIYFSREGKSHEEACAYTDLWLKDRDDIIAHVEKSQDHTSIIMIGALKSQIERLTTEINAYRDLLFDYYELYRKEHPPV